MFEYRYIPKIMMVPIGSLIVAPFNPASRTEKNRLTKLLAGIKELGGIAYPIIVSNDMRVIDGHRRLESLKLLGATEVPVIVLPLGLQQAYRVLNTTQSPITSKEWAVVLSLGYFEENLPQKVRRDIVAIRQLLGDEGIQMIVDRGIAPGVVGEAGTIAKYVDEIQNRRERPEPARHKQVLLWLIEQGQQAAAKAAVSARMSPGLLRYAIESNSKLTGAT